MAETFKTEAPPPRMKWLKKYRAWLLLGLTLLLVVFVRVRLREMPLERDEGEYAYAGQLILRGVPPYQEAYNMKLPGTYAAYAIILAVFGQTVSSIHLGLLIVNAASILLVFLLGRKLMDDVAGTVAALTYALLSLSPSVLGLAGHATHFVVLPALGGMLLLLHALKLEDPSRSRVAGMSFEPSLTLSKTRPVHLFFSGILFGLSFVMKQHGLFFGVFGVVFLSGTRVAEMLAVRSTIRERFGTPRASIPRQPPKPIPAETPDPLPVTPPPARKSILAAQSQSRQETAPSNSIDPAGVSSKSLVPGLSVEAGKGAGARPASHLQPLRARQSTPAPRPEIPVIPWSIIVREFVIFSVGLAIPYLLTCLILLAVGVFPQFKFWTISYAARYASAVPMLRAAQEFRQSLSIVVSPNLVFWVLGAVGAVVMWWDPRLTNRRRFLMTTLLICSILSVSVGFYFREHYFILLLPVMASLCGIATSQAIANLKNPRGLDLLLAIPLLLVFIVALGVSILGHAQAWFIMKPDELVRAIYGTSLFAESIKAADYLKTNTPANTRIAVIGSEPQIYFYSQRRSATGYIYTYPLMENQPFATRMQKELIAEVEKAKPEYVIFVNDVHSWLPNPGYDRGIYDWWQGYWTTNLDLVHTISVEGERESEANSQLGNYGTGTGSSILILKKKSSASAVSPKN